MKMYPYAVYTPKSFVDLAHIRLSNHFGMIFVYVVRQGFNFFLLHVEI